MADITMGLSEASENFCSVADEVNRTGVPVTVLRDDKPWVVIAHAGRDAVSVALDFMDEYSGVFEELAN